MVYFLDTQKEYSHIFLYREKPRYDSIRHASEQLHSVTEAINAFLIKPVNSYTQQLNNQYFAY